MSGSARVSSTLEQEFRRSRWCWRPDGTFRLGCPSTPVSRRAATSPEAALRDSGGEAAAGMMPTAVY